MSLNAPLAERGDIRFSAFYLCGFRDFLRLVAPRDLPISDGEGWEGKGLFLWGMCGKSHEWVTALTSGVFSHHALLLTCPTARHCFHRTRSGMKHPIGGYNHVSHTHIQTVTLLFRRNPPTLHGASLQTGFAWLMLWLAQAGGGVWVSSIRFWLRSELVWWLQRGVKFLSDLRWRHCKYLSL